MSDKYFYSCEKVFAPLKIVSEIFVSGPYDSIYICTSVCFNTNLATHTSVLSFDRNKV